MEPLSQAAPQPACVIVVHESTRLLAQPFRVAKNTPQESDYRLQSFARPVGVVVVLLSAARVIVEGAMRHNLGEMP